MNVITLIIKTRLVAKMDIDFVPTYTQLRANETSLYCLVFGHPSKARCYECKFDEKVSPLVVYALYSQQFAESCEELVSIGVGRGQVSGIRT